MNTGHRLIEEEQAGPKHEGPHDLDQPFLPSAHHPRVVGLLRAHPESLEEGPRLFSQPPLVVDPVALAQERPEQRVASVAGRCDQQVLEHCEARELRGELKGANQPQARSPVGRKPGYVSALEDDGPAGGRQGAGEHRQEGRLSGAVGPDQPGDPARSHFDGDAVDGVQALEMAMHVAGDQ